MLSWFHITQRHSRWMGNAKLESIWQEAVVAWSRYFSSNLYRGPDEDHKNHEGWLGSGRDSKRVPTEYKLRTLSLHKRSVLALVTLQHTVWGECKFIIFCMSGSARSAWSPRERKGTQVRTILFANICIYHIYIRKKFNMYHKIWISWKSTNVIPRLLRRCKCLMKDNTNTVELGYTVTKRTECVVSL
jgi:hypothetical protein